MKKLFIFIIAVKALLPIGVLSAHEGHDHSKEAGGAAEQKQAESMQYVCPMHADVQSDKPGECLKCGMTLKRMETKRESDEAHSDAGPEITTSN